MDALPIHRLAVLGVIESYEGLIHNSKRRCRRAAENCFFFLCVCVPWYKRIDMILENILDKVVHSSM